MADDGNRRQPPKPESQSVLRMAIEASASSENSTGERVVQEMTPERREWLRQALSDIVQEDDVVKMRKCLDILRKYQGSDDEESTEAMSDSLEILLDTVERIDNAMDLHKIGGLKLIGELLQHSLSEVRSGAAEIIAVCSQNNPFCQDAILEELQLLPPLCELLDSDQVDVVRIKALYAISGLIREHELARKRFIQNHGLSIIMRAMQIDNKKLRVKAAFLLRYIIGKDPDSLDDVSSMGMAEQLIAMLQGPIESYHEHILGALTQLVSNEIAVRDCCRPELNFRQFLTEKINSLHAADPLQYQEQIDYCTRLMKICFNDASGEDADMNR